MTDSPAGGAPDMPMNPGEAQVDELLVHRMRRGDAAAFAALATRYWSAVHRIGWNMLPDRAAAGELAEAALLSALWPAEELPSDVPFRTSLYRQAMSQSLIRLHSLPSADTRSLAAFLPRFDAGGRLTSAGSDWSESTETVFGRRDVGEPIRETLQRLDALDRAAFVLREIEQLSIEEAAAVLEISPESIRQRTHRASLILTGFLRTLAS
jgi:RNA polymerase sigma-70 factor (ECF subfamily)